MANHCWYSNSELIEKYYALKKEKEKVSEVLVKSKDVDLELPEKKIKFHIYIILLTI